MFYTLGTAAKAAGIAKSMVLRAIRDHRISAAKGDTGDWQIDPAEFHRFFPPVPTQHDIPLLEPRNFEVLAASLKAINAALLCRDHCPGTERQLELEKTIAWETQRRAEAETRARLCAQEERRRGKLVGLGAEAVTHVVAKGPIERDAVGTLSLTDRGRAVLRAMLPDL